MSDRKDIENGARHMVERHGPMAAARARQRARLLAFEGKREAAESWYRIAEYLDPTEPAAFFEPIDLAAERLKRQLATPPALKAS